MIHHAYEQGSPEWLAVRRGCITGSRFKDAREKLALRSAALRTSQPQITGIAA